jgi:hypothetical protein
MTMIALRTQFCQVLLTISDSGKWKSSNTLQFLAKIVIALHVKRTMGVKLN